MSIRLILFSIAGIQNFIINSKKVQDLSNSSEILSSLIKSGIEYIENRYNGKLILPISKKDEYKNLPNYLFMEFESDKSIGLEIEEHLKSEYMSMLIESEVYKKCLCKISREEDIKRYLENQIKGQLGATLEIYWVERILDNSIYKGEQREYKLIYKEMYEYFDATKNVKKSISLNEEGEKCSICGIRNGIFKGKLKNNYRIQKQYKYKDITSISLCNLIYKLQKSKIKIDCNNINSIKSSSKVMCFESNHLKDNEVLCAPCMLKRIFNIKKYLDAKETNVLLNEVAIASCENKSDDDNTSDIGHINYNQNTNTVNNLSLANITLSRWIQFEIKQDKTVYDDYKNQLIKNNKNNMDLYEVMYKDNWNKFLEESCGENIGLVKPLLVKAFNKVKNKELPKYYCVYRMDIDNLGKWMSGHNLKNDEKLYEYQSKLSKNIECFFYEIEKLFSNGSIYGKLVYAGGDDLLAIIPVNDMFKLYYSVNESFKKHVQINDDKHDYTDITYSTGMFIAHYKTPLGEILRVSKEKIDMVKDKFKNKENDFDTIKDASIISVMTEGYDNRSVYFKNKNKGKLYMDLFINIMKLFSDGDIKEPINYKVNDEIFNKIRLSYFHDQLQTEFIDIDKNIKYQCDMDNIVDMIFIEQRRLIMRSVKKSNIEKDETLKEICSDLNNNIIRFMDNNCDRNGQLDLENYFNLFHIIRALNMYMVVYKNE